MRAGRAAAFEELYDRHSPGLLSFCRHMLGSMEEAEDAVQQTFISAHKALLADEREIHLKAWLYAIARNKCLSLLRARRERVGLDEELEAGPSTAGLSAEVERREDLRSVLGDLARLPEDQRSALLLSELGAHSHDEVAEVLGVKREKVKALVFQAREGLSAQRIARETPCQEIREELSTARGGALRRGNLRRHLEVCTGCRTFRDEVGRQRVAFGAILPVVPSLALKQAVLGGIMTAGAGGAATGGALIGGAGGVGAKAAAAKLMTVVAVAGGATGAGVVTVKEVRGKDVPAAVAGPAQPRSVASPSASSGEATAQATPLPPRPATPPTPATHRAKRVTAHARPVARHRRTSARRHRRNAATAGTTVQLERAPTEAVAPVEERPRTEREHGDGGGPGPSDNAGPGKREDRSGKDKDQDKSDRGRKRGRREHPHGGPPGQLKKPAGFDPPGQARKRHDKKPQDFNPPGQAKKHAKPRAAGVEAGNEGPGPKAGNGHGNALGNAEGQGPNGPAHLVIAPPAQ